MERILYILVGAPGSGKSYWVKNALEPKHPGLVEACADHWFERTGTYVFDPNQLAQAHRFSQKTAEDAMNMGLPVVVSNTNTRHRERRDYLKMAEKRGYTVKVVVFPDRGYTNIHGVPPDKVQAMRDRIDLEPGVYLWTYGPGLKSEYKLISPFPNA